MRKKQDNETRGRVVYSVEQAQLKTQQRRRQQLQDKSLPGSPQLRTLMNAKVKADVPALETALKTMVSFEWSSHNAVGKP